MMNLFIICFDFNKLREGFSNIDIYEDFAVLYIDECTYVKDKLIELFPNKIIDLSNNSFLLKTELDETQIMNILIDLFSEKIRDNKVFNNIEKQIYLAKIDSFKSNTFTRKDLEIEYIINNNK